MTVPPAAKAWLVDTGERVGSTLAEAGLGWLTVELGHLPAIYGVLLAGALAVLKAQVAKLFNGTVSPASFAPAQQPGQAQQDAPPDPGPENMPNNIPGADVPPVAYTAPRPTVHIGDDHHVFVATIPETISLDGGRLGRHIEHDARSRSFQVAKADTLQSVSWKRHVPAFDQGNLGSCTGNALAGVLSTAPFTHRFGEARALKLYEAATRLDNVPGQYKPDDTGSTGLAVCKAAQEARLITSYLHAFRGVADVVHALQSGPGITGVNWYDSFDAPDSNGIVTISPGAVVRGGHEFEIAGVHLATSGTFSGNDLFECWQSWGQWGHRGRFYLAAKDLDRLLHEQGDFTQPVK